MPNIELVQTYTSQDFGKPDNKGEYRIRSDSKSYQLMVDGVPVINLSLEYERYTTLKPDYYTVYISYNNNYSYSNNSKYLNKGYATMAVRMLVDELLKKNICAKVSLDITRENKPSLRVAEKNGFTYIRNNEYSIYNPNALKMIEEGLSPLQNVDHDTYAMQLSYKLRTYQKYLADISEKKRDNEDEIRTKCPK